MKMKFPHALSGVLAVLLLAGNTPAAEPAPVEKKWSDYIEVSGMLRVRPEIKVNNGFVADSASDTHFVGQKLWLSVAAKPTDMLKLVMTLQDSREWGGEQSAINGISTSYLSTGFREAYFDLGLVPDRSVSVTAGRQKIAFGDQRLFGTLEWNNVGRSFDALRADWKTEKNQLAIWSSVVQEGNSVYAISQTPDLPDTLFNGLYNTLNIADFLYLDVYYANKLDTTDSTTLKHHTVGARFTDRNPAGKTPKEFPLDFSLEGAYQFGTKSDKTVSAYAAALQVGYTINAGFPIRIGLEGDIASGDTDSTDNTVGTFDNLYPTNHGHYGMADMISWQNMLAFSGNISMIFSKQFGLTVSYWYFQRMTANDSWYAVTGGANTNNTWITGTSGTSSQEFLAHEVELLVKSEISKNVDCELGYAVVLPGDAVTDAGKSDLVHFGYISAIAKF